MASLPHRDRTSLLPSMLYRGLRYDPWGFPGGSMVKNPPTSAGRASLIAQLEKNPPAMQETLARFLGQEDPLEKG